MRRLARQLIYGLAVVALSAPAFADSNDQADVEALPKSVETGKERLAGKATDEQRVDNCKVPPEKRGSKSRPSACTHENDEAK